VQNSGAGVEHFIGNEEVGGIPAFTWWGHNTGSECCGLPTPGTGDKLIKSQLLGEVYVPFLREFLLWFHDIQEGELVRRLEDEKGWAEE
jgi:hypothetical protein